MTQTVSETAQHPLAPARLNQPWRGLVALAEVVVAAVLVVLAIWLWRQGFTTVLTPFQPGEPPLASTVISGPKLGVAVLLVVLGGLLVTDAVREVLLALGTRVRPRTRLTEIVDDFTPPAE